MKKIIVIVISGMLLMSCYSNTDKPDNLIDEDKMVDILYDLYLVNSIQSNNFQFLETQEVITVSYIYNKYKIDSLQFADSDRYYATEMDEYEKLHLRVMKRLEENKAIIDTLGLKNPKKKKIDIQAKSKKTPLKIEDSLQRSRVMGKKIFNKSTQN